MSEFPYYGNALSFPGRMLLAEASKDGDEAIPGQELCWLSADFDHYLIRTAHMAIVSNRGGSPLTLATQTSDKYDGRPVWQPNIAVATGDEYGWCNTVYAALDSGPTGMNPPTHLSGDASDGLRMWRFVERIMRTPTVLNMLLDNDGLKDGVAAWLAYWELNRRNGAGSTYLEYANKNCGDLVVNDPFNPQPSGNTINFRMVAGGDDTYGPLSANASTCGMTFEKGARRWMKAFCFADDAFEDHGGGIFIPLAFGRNQRLRQFAGQGLTGADIHFNVTDSNQRVALHLFNGVIELRSLGYPMATFENGDGPGAIVSNWVALVAHGDGVGYAEIRARNNSGQPHRDLKLTPKGVNGRIRFGKFQPITTEQAVIGYIEMRDDDGLLCKLAVVQ